MRAHSEKKKDFITMTNAIVPQAIENQERKEGPYPSESMVVLAQTNLRGETLTVRGVPEAQAIVRVDLGRHKQVRAMPACGYVRRPGSGGSPLALVSLADAERALESVRGDRSRAIRDALRDTARDWRREQAREQAAAEIGQSAEAYVQALDELEDMIAAQDVAIADYDNRMREAAAAADEARRQRADLVAARAKVSASHMAAVAREDVRLGAQHNALLEASDHMARELGQQAAIEELAAASPTQGIRWTMTQLARRIGTSESRCWQALGARGLAERRTVYSPRTGQVVRHGVWVPTRRGEAAGITREGTRMTSGAAFSKRAGKQIEVPAPGIVTPAGAAAVMDSLHLVGCDKTEVQHHAVIHKEHTDTYLARRKRILDEMPWSTVGFGDPQAGDEAEKIVAAALGLWEEDSHAALA